MQRIRFFNNDTYEFLKSFDDKIVAKIFGLFEVLEEVGAYLSSRKLKKVTKEIYELRIVGKTSIRILLCFRHGEIYILHAFVKKSQKIPKRELEIAINRSNYLQ